MTIAVDIEQSRERFTERVGEGAELAELAGRPFDGHKVECGLLVSPISFAIRQAIAVRLRFRSPDPIGGL